MTDESQDDQQRVSRRSYIRFGAVTLGAGLAGCTSTNRSNRHKSNTNPTSSQTTKDETTTSHSQLDEPAPVDGSDHCAVCNMSPAKYPDWNAQLSLQMDSGRRAYFCSPGCFVAFIATPSHFIDGVKPTDIIGAWVRDYESKTLIDATEADWVLEPNAKRIDAPMMRNPLPFISHDDALAYVEKIDDLTSHAIVGLSTFQPPLAAFFRAKFLPTIDEPSQIEPAPIPKDATCAVCSMKPTMHPEAAGQATLESGERVFFCSPGCATAFYAVPGHFHEGATQESIVSLWVHDYETGNRIDGLLASYVLSQGINHPDLPMARNPIPFENTKQAKAYVKEIDHLSIQDIVDIQTFDKKLAANYRSEFL